MRMLVVDDDAEVQRLRDELEPRGVQIVGTPNADDALRLWEKEGPWSLVLTGYHIKMGKRIEDAKQLMKAIRDASPSQRMALHTNDMGLLATPVPVMRRPCRIDHLLRILRQPVLPLSAPSK